MKIKSLEQITRPLERQEQMAVAGYLDAIGVVWFHVPNERRVPKNKQHAVNYIRELYRQGLKKGIPDNWILTRPPFKPEKIGAVFELKRIGEIPTDEQLQWLIILSGLGFETGWFEGAEAAINWCKSLGYK